jgi:hypothetical protein
MKQSKRSGNGMEIFLAGEGLSSEVSGWTIRRSEHQSALNIHQQNTMKAWKAEGIATG